MNIPAHEEMRVRHERRMPNMVLLCMTIGAIAASLDAGSVDPLARADADKSWKYEVEIFVTLPAVGPVGTLVQTRQPVE